MFLTNFDFDYNVNLDLVTSDCTVGNSLKTAGLRKMPKVKLRGTSNCPIRGILKTATVELGLEGIKLKHHLGQSLSH